MRQRNLPRGLAQAGALASVLITANTAVNLRLVRRPSAGPCPPLKERVSVLLPARNEARRVTACLESLLAQESVPDLEIVVLDDGSTDGTGQIVHRVAGQDPRVKVLDGDDVDPPTGWLGKPWACHRLAEAATGSVLVFVDADVVLSPHAVASAVVAMRQGGLELVSPYPRQRAESPAERITQPLVTWSWLATLPLALAAGPSPTWSAAIGQFLVVDAAAYRDAGGHTAVADFVVEDVAVLRSMKRAGYRGMPMDGSAIAECRMYDGAAEVYQGYCKSLWSVFGSLPAAAGAVSAMVLIYVVPTAVALTSRDASARRWGLLGYASAVAGRALVAQRTGERMLPDVLAQPASVGAFAALTVASVLRKRFGSLTWRGRRV
ncbi:MAG: glycosyltransferase family 2 protein [Candidatus Nanopelagicales bacterium]